MSKQREEARSTLIGAINGAVLELLMDRGVDHAEITVAEGHKMQGRYSGALFNLERAVRAEAIEDVKQAVEDLD